MKFLRELYETVRNYLSQENDLVKDLEDCGRAGESALHQLSLSFNLGEQDYILDN